MSLRSHWRRVAVWTAGAVVALALLLGAGLWLLLHSGRMHQYLLRTARAHASAVLGSGVQIGDFAFHFSGLAPSVDLYNVVVAGAPPYQNPPLLRVDHVHLGIQITSLLRRAWHLSRLEVDHPVLWFLEDASGRTNLPPLLRGSGSSSGADVFDLGIRHAVLNRGELYVNHRPSQLQADLRQVTFQAAFDRRLRRYVGSFGYTDGHIQYQHFRPIPHALEVAFAATSTELDLPRLVASSGGSRLQAMVRWLNYAHPRISTTYQLTLDATQARAIFFEPALPAAGSVAVTGSAAYASQAGEGWLNAVTAAGSFSSSALAMEVAGLQTPVRALSGRYHLAHGDLDVTAVRAALLGGQASATLSIRDVAATAAAHLQAEVHGARLDQAARFAGPGAATLGHAGITGTVDGSADAHWDGSFAHLVLAADASLAAALAGAPAPLRLTGAVHARYAGDQLSLLHSALTSPESSLTANGTIGTAGAGAALQVRLQSNDLHELETIADRVRLALVGQPLAPLGLYGVGSFVGAITGALDAPRITGEIAAANLRARGTEWRSAGAAITASPEQFSATNGVLQTAAGAGRIAFQCTVGLEQWAFSAASPLQLNLEASGIALDQVAKLVGRPLPVSGVLTAKLALHGTEQSLAGQGSASLAHAKVVAGPVSEALQSVSATFEGAGDAVRGSLQATAPAGKLQASGTYFLKQQSYDVQLHADGIRLDRLQTVAARRVPVQGVVSLDGSGRGSIANPEFQATLAAPTLEIQNQAVTALTLQASLANHIVHATLDSKAVQTTLRGQATVTLGGDYPATASLDTQSIPVAPLLAVYAPSLAGRIAGEAEIHATLRGPLRDINQVQAQVVLPVLRLNYGDAVQLAAAAPVRLDLAHGLLTLQKTDIEGTNTSLRLAGTIAIKSPEAMKAPLNLTAAGTVDLKILRALDADITPAGQLQIGLTAGGSLSAPALAGEIQVVNASLSTPALPIGLQGVNGVLRLGGDRLDITNLSGTVGGGTLTASGGVAFGEEVGGGVQFSLGLAARQVRLLFPSNVRDELSADLTLTGATEAAFLNGQVRLDNVSVTPQFDLAAFIAQVSGSNAVVAAPGSFTQNLALNIAISTPNQINTVSRDFSLEGSANLTLRGTAAEPVLLGRFNVTNGDLIFRGNRYVVQGGTLDFVNPNQTQPVVNLTADTSIQEYNLHLHFQGPANNLHASYTSDPALPPADIINLLAFGQTNEASAANPTPGNLGAENIIASAVSSQITDRVQKIAGISQLSVDPVLGGNQQNAGARITVQQRVTGNLFVTISSDVTSTQRDVIEVQYKLSPKVSVSAVRDQNGGVGVNASFKKVW